MRITWKKRMLSLALCLLMVFPLVDWKPIEGKAHGFWDDFYHIHTPACYPDYKISCGIEQGSETNHVHSLECFTYDDSNGPICGLEEGPIEDSALYTQNHVGYFLSCEIEEHIHSDSCYTWKQVIKRESTESTPSTNESVEVPAEDPAEDSNAESPSIDGPIEDPIEDTNEEIVDTQSPSTDEPTEEPSTVTEDTPSIEEPAESSIVTEDSDSTQEPAEPSETLEDDNPLTGDFEKPEETPETPPPMDGYIEVTGDTEKDQTVTPSTEEPAETPENSIENNSETSQEPQPTTPPTQTEQVTPEPDIDSIVADLESPEYPAFVTETIYEDEVPEDAIYGTGEYEGLIRGTLLCTKEEHTHTYKDCPTRALTEWRKVYHRHHHTFACYDTYHTVCGLDEDESHYHTLDCYEGEGKLLCGMDENDTHCHNTTDKPSEELEYYYFDGKCKVITKVLICTENSDSHSHTDSCFEEIYRCRPSYYEEAKDIVDDGIHRHTPCCYPVFSLHCEDWSHLTGYNSHKEYCFTNISDTTYCCGLEEGQPHTHNEDGWVCYTNGMTYQVEYEGKLISIPLYYCRNYSKYDEQAIIMEPTWVCEGTMKVDENDPSRLIGDDRDGSAYPVLNITINQDIAPGDLWLPYLTELESETTPGGKSKGYKLKLYSFDNTTAPIMVDKIGGSSMCITASKYSPYTWYDLERGITEELNLQAHDFAGGYFSSSWWDEDNLYFSQNISINEKILPAGTHISIPLILWHPAYGYIGNPIYDGFRYYFGGNPYDVEWSSEISHFPKEPVISYMEFEEIYDYEQIELFNSEIKGKFPVISDGDLVAKISYRAEFFNGINFFDLDYKVTTNIGYFPNGSKEYHIASVRNSTGDLASALSWQDEDMSFDFFYILIPKEEVNLLDNCVYLDYGILIDVTYPELDISYTVDETYSISKLYSVYEVTGDKYRLDVESGSVHSGGIEDILSGKNLWEDLSCTAKIYQQVNVDYDRVTYNPRPIEFGIDYIRFTEYDLTSEDYSIDRIKCEVSDDVFDNIGEKHSIHHGVPLMFDLYIKRGTQDSDWILIDTQEVEPEDIRNYHTIYFTTDGITDIVAIKVIYRNSTDYTRLNLKFALHLYATDNIKEIVRKNLSGINLYAVGFLNGWSGNECDSLTEKPTLSNYLAGSSFVNLITTKDKIVFSNLIGDTGKYIHRDTDVIQLKPTSIGNYGSCSVKTLDENLVESRTIHGTSSLRNNEIGLNWDVFFFLDADKKSDLDIEQNRMLHSIDGIRGLIRLPGYMKFVSLSVDSPWELVSKEIVFDSIEQQQNIYYELRYLGDNISTNRSMSYNITAIDTHGTLMPRDYTIDTTVIYYSGGKELQVGNAWFTDLESAVNYPSSAVNKNRQSLFKTVTFVGDSTATGVSLFVSSPKDNLETIKVDLHYGDTYTYKYNYYGLEPSTDIVIWAPLEDKISAGAEISQIRFKDGETNIPTIFANKSDLNYDLSNLSHYTPNLLKSNLEGWEQIAIDAPNLTEYKSFAFYYGDSVIGASAGNACVYIDMKPPESGSYILDHSVNQVFAHDKHISTGLSSTFLANKVHTQYDIDGSIKKRSYCDGVSSANSTVYTDIDTPYQWHIHTTLPSKPFKSYFIVDNIEQDDKTFESYVSEITFSAQDISGNTISNLTNDDIELYTFTDYIDYIDYFDYGTNDVVYSDFLELARAGIPYNEVADKSTIKAFIALVKNTNLTTVNVEITMLPDNDSLISIEQDQGYAESNNNYAYFFVNDYGEHCWYDYSNSHVSTPYNLSLLKMVGDGDIGDENWDNTLSINYNYSTPYDYYYRVYVDTGSVFEKSTHKDFVIWDPIESNDLSSTNKGTITGVNISPILNTIDQQRRYGYTTPEYSFDILYSSDELTYTDYANGTNVSILTVSETGTNDGLIELPTDTRTVGLRVKDASGNPLSNTCTDKYGREHEVFTSMAFYVLMKYPEGRNIDTTEQLHNTASAYVTFDDLVISRTSNTTIVEIIPDDPVYLPFAGGTTTLPVYTIGTTLILGSWLAIKRRKN